VLASFSLSAFSRKYLISLKKRHHTKGVHILKFLIVFLGMAVFDFLYAIYTRAVIDKKSFRGGSLACLMVLVQGLIIVSYTKEPKLLIAAALGAFIGTYIGIRLEVK